MSGMIAGRAWQQPLEEGAHLMTMSTYKSLGGPPSGLIVTNDAALAERLDAIAYPGLTANFDAAKSAAARRSRCSTGRCTAAPTPPPWRDRDRAGRGAGRARRAGVRARPRHHHLAPVRDRGGRASAAARRRRSGCARPTSSPAASACRSPPVDGDVNGLRLGTPEIVRWGMTADDMPELARFIADALADDRASRSLAENVTTFRRRFSSLALHPLSDPRIDSHIRTRSRSVRDRNLSTIV